MFLRGVGNVLDPVTRVRPVPSYGQIDFKTGGCVDAISMAGLYDIAGCGRATYDALQVSTSRRFRGGFTGGMQYQFSRNRGTTQGSNEAVTAQNTFDFENDYGINPQDIPHTFDGFDDLPAAWRRGVHRRLARWRHRQLQERRAGQRHHLAGPTTKPSTA